MQGVEHLRCHYEDGAVVVAAPGFDALRATDRVRLQEARQLPRVGP